MGFKLTEQQKLNDLIFYEKKDETNFLSIYDLNDEELKDFKADDRYILTACKLFMRDSSPFDVSYPDFSAVNKYVSKDDIKISLWDKIKLFFGANEQEIYYSYGYITDDIWYYFVGIHYDNYIDKSFKDWSTYNNDCLCDDYAPYKKDSEPDSRPVVTNYYDGFGNTVWTDGRIESINPFDENFK